MVATGDEDCDAYRVMYPSPEVGSGKATGVPLIGTYHCVRFYSRYGGHPSPAVGNVMAATSVAFIGALRIMAHAVNGKVDPSPIEGSDRANSGQALIGTFCCKPHGTRRYNGECFTYGKCGVSPVPQSTSELTGSANAEERLQKGTELEEHAPQRFRIPSSVEVHSSWYSFLKY